MRGEDGPLSGKSVQPRRVALLALLACHPRHTLNRDKLIAFLWPESDAAQGRHRLSESLYVLRKSLGEETLISEGDRVRLDPDRIRCDVVSFRRALEEGDLEEAVALYAGPLLDGFFLRGADEFHQWLESERRTLADDCSRALEALASASDQSGRSMEAVGWWTRSTAHDPYNSRFVLGLMQALARAGDPGNAVHHALQHAHRLRDELGAEPPPEILVYTDRLREGEAHGAAAEGPRENAGPGGPALAFDNGPAPLVDGRADTREESTAGQGGSSRSWAAGAWFLIALLGAATLYASLAWDRTPGLDPDLVAVPRFENQTGDPKLDEACILAAFWVEETLQQVQGVRLLPSSFTRPPAPGVAQNGRSEPWRVMVEGTNAGWAVNGIIADRGDSLEIRVQIINRSRATTEQQVVEVGARDSLTEVLDRVAQRVGGALAFEFDPVLEEMEGRFQPLESPPTLEAFREHRLGYQATDWGDPADAFQHHLTAYALDTTLVRAVVAAAYMAGDYHVKDSLARYAGERQHLLSRMGKLELELLTALMAGNHELAVQVAREGARLQGEGYSLVAQAFFALRVNLPGEALDATGRYDPDLEWRRYESHSYWLYRTQALHMLGRFQEELAEAREGRKRFPTHLGLLIAEVRARAALGEVEAVSQLLLEARSIPQTHDPVGLVAGRELRAHGSVTASREAFEQAARWLRDDLEEDGGNLPNLLHLAGALYGAERWAESLAVADSLLAEEPNNLSALGLVGLACARLGNSARTEEIMERLSGMAQPARPGEELYQMAAISAVMGRSDEAMGFLSRAYAEGVPHGLRLHQDMNFESLREREDFGALVAPKG